MISEGVPITEVKDGFYQCTLGGKTFTRINISSLETIIHMYNKGGAYRETAINLPANRTEWRAETLTKELATGREVTYIHKEAVNPTGDVGLYADLVGGYDFVPEAGKSLKAVEDRAQFIHDHPITDKEPSVLDRFIGLGAGSVRAVKGIRLPDFPTISTPFKAVGTLLMLFVVGIIALVAIGYSGLGSGAGEIASREHKRKR